MYSISADSAAELFTQGCRSLATYGVPVAPRGMATRELLGAHLRLSRPRHRFVDVAPTRVLNPAFAAAEALWILSGSEDPWIFLYNERLRRFADHGRLQGAYGPRLRRWHGHCDQLDAVRRVLEHDGDSRQAVIQLFDPARDFSGYRDVPCTLGYRFYVREGTLVMFTTMRSQDVWLGLPYDLFTTTILHELLAGWLGVEVGDYHHLIDSLHLYGCHAALAEELHHRPQPSQGALAPLAVPWADFDDLLAQVIAGEAVGDPGWDDFAAVMSSYRLWKQGDYDNARALLTDSHQPLTTALGRWYALLATEAGAGTSTPAIPAPVPGRVTA